MSEPLYRKELNPAQTFDNGLNGLGNDYIDLAILYFNVLFQGAVTAFIGDSYSGTLSFICA